jgi:cullin 2
MNPLETITLVAAEVRMTHLDRPYFVTMGTYQMAILLQFNEHQQLTLTEIEEATKLNMKELEKQTNSLIEAKFLVGSSVSVQTVRLHICL